MSSDLCSRLVYPEKSGTFWVIIRSKDNSNLHLKCSVSFCIFKRTIWRNVGRVCPFQTLILTRNIIITFFWTSDFPGYRIASFWLFRRIVIPENTNWNADQEIQTFYRRLSVSIHSKYLGLRQYHQEVTTLGKTCSSWKWVYPIRSTKMPDLIGCLKFKIKFQTLNV